VLLRAKVEPPGNGRALDPNVPARLEPEATLPIGVALCWLEPFHQ
jgi:hypothetical protein